MAIAVHAGLSCALITVAAVGQNNSDEYFFARQGGSGDVGDGLLL